MKRLLSFVCLSFLFLACGYAGPFGLNFGWSIEDMIEAGVKFISPSSEDALEEDRWQKENGSNGFIYSSMDILPPEPSDLFPFYKIKYSPELGLYQIIAYDGSMTIFEESPRSLGNDDNYGVSEDYAMHIFDRAYNSLLLKYGKNANYAGFFADNDWKYWQPDHTPDHLHITLIYGESTIYKDFQSMVKSLANKEADSGRPSGKYYIYLEYDQEEYLQAIRDSEVL